MESLRLGYVENTRNALLDAGRELFSSRDYVDVSTEDIVRAAGLTRGALYHHFQGKQGLFDAVYCEVEDELAQRVSKAMQSYPDAWQRILVGASAYLERCRDNEFHHLALQQSVIALGWHRCVEIDMRYVGGILADAAREAIAVGDLKPYPPELFVTSFYGVLTNMGMFIAGADDPQAAQQDALRCFADMLAGLRI